MRQAQVIRWLGKPLVFLSCAAPFLAMLAGALEWGGFTLGANPIEALLHKFGEWGLNFLFITLMISPLRWASGWAWVMRFRRMLGLFAFFYVALHFTVYFWLDQSLSLDAVFEDILERPYITLGFTGLLGLLPLAATSTRAMMRRLGRNWQKLHRLIYPIAILGVWHFWWQVKEDITEPLIYAAVLAALLGARWWRTRAK